ncbi:MAG: iron-containing redox enzyme family protein [Actinobacteria bacterium]|nr:iron-containing redox enzyme family protein [Actinomycetota bacterium]
MTPLAPGSPLAPRRLPSARGPISEYLLDCLRRPPHELGPLPSPRGDALVDDDLHLALYTCYELHYRGFEGVADEWEWEPSLLALRADLEDAFVSALIADIGEPAPSEIGGTEEALQQILARSNGPSMSAYMAREGTLENFREFAVHRSAYQLKEADPHTWAIPRLWGEAKAALVFIQADEYGNGQPDAVHAERFAVTMDALSLDPGYGAYLDHIPGVTLATVNLVSMFGLHRRWRGALVGHLAIFEMASVVPMGRYSDALRRLGLGSPAVDFYDVHVEADQVHQVVALRNLAAAFARQEPDRAGDVLLGARALMAVERRFTEHLLASWSTGLTSLYRPLALPDTTHVVPWPPDAADVPCPA